jgi:transcriptional regulator with XRE-family HTH domain
MNRGNAMKITDSKSFGEMIKKRRKKMGYTQKYVCEVSGISASFISDLENGKASIELGKAIYLANLLGIDIELNERGI